MNIAIGTYGDPFALEKELVIDSFNHTFVDGVSGVGKSTLLEDVAIQTIRAGKPLLYIDPHGTSERRGARRAASATRSSPHSSLSMMTASGPRNACRSSRLPSTS